MKRKHLLTLALAFISAMAFAAVQSINLSGLSNSQGDEGTNVVNTTDAQKPSGAAKVKTDGVRVLTAEPLDIAAGGTADLVINMDYETTENVTAWGFSLYLPEGLTPIYDEEDEMWLGELGDINAKKVIKKGLTLQKKADGGYLIVGYADGNPKMKSTHGHLVSITLQATGSVQGTGLITQISLSSDMGESLDQGNIADATFDVNGGGNTPVIPDPEPVVTPTLNILTAAPLIISSGSTADLVVNMDYNTEETVVSWAFSLYLPEGIEPVYNEEDQEWAGEVGSINATAVIRKGLSIEQKEDGGYLVTGYADGNPAMRSTHGVLVSIRMKATKDVHAMGYIKQISVSNNMSESLDQGKFLDTSFEIVAEGNSNPEPVTPSLNVLSAESLYIGPEGTANLVVNMDYTTSETVTAWGFTLYLPDGIAPIYDEDNDGWVGEMGEINASKVIRKGLEIQKKEDGGYLIVGYADGNPAMKSTHGHLVTIALRATKEVQGTGRITGISISNDKSESLDQGKFLDATFSIVAETPRFIPPTVLTVTSTYLLDWLDQTEASYKPIVNVTTDGYDYGRLTVEGTTPLSMEKFSMTYNPGYGRQAFASLVNSAQMRADNVGVDMTLRANRWEFVTFPFDVKVGSLRLSNADLPFAIRTYDGQKRADGYNNETWVDMTAESTLQAGKGYIFRIPAIYGTYATFGFDALQTANKNNIFANGNVEVPLANYESEFGHNRSWNLIGNPYPSFYDIRAMQTSAPITVWNATSQSYEAYSPADDPYILTPGQAFFVQRPVDEQSITFLKEGRQTSLSVRNISYGGAARSDMQGASRSVFNLVLSANGQSDRTRFVINGNASLDYEPARDASKFQSLEPTAVQLYTLEGGVRYSINERPVANGVIGLGLQIAEDGLYTIVLDTKAGQEVTLIDHVAGQQVRLDGNAEGYAFASEAGTFDSRFSIVLGNGEATGITDIENGRTQMGTIYDLQGRPVGNAKKGVYVVNGKKTVVK